MRKALGKIKDRYFDREYRVSDLFRDLLAGLIVGLISIPISMGYAQVAGIPMVYGLYGSLLPILFFGLLTTSRNFVFGVDAAPAALVAGTLVSLNISAETLGAMQVVPTMAVLVGIWLLLFWMIKAGQIVKYISTPVMGGFVTGICCTVILMQLPKLFGGSAGVGEAAHLLAHIFEERRVFHPLSFALGVGTLAVLLLCKRFVPKLPMPVVMMVFGVWLTKRYHVDALGVRLLPHVDAGLPGITVRHTTWQMVLELAFPSLVIAIVILAETLLASKGVALKEGYSLKPEKEVFAYAVGNLISAAFGCLPVNGSVSRTGLARQYGARSQLMSAAASLTMVGVLLWGTPYIEYMPVPVLTAIVISALIGACEFDLAAKLFHTSRVECYIFFSAFFGVLLFGTIYGVVIGMLLSFILVIYRAVIPPRSFLGVIPGRSGFFDLKRYRGARKVKETVIYRFSGNLFFANIDTFQSDIENAVTDDTRQVIVNAAGITQLDVTAAERLVLFKKKLEKAGIGFYLTEHLGDINDRLKAYDAKELLIDGNVRRTMELALRDCGLTGPYPLEMEEREHIEVLQPVEYEEMNGEIADSSFQRGHQVEKRMYGDNTELEWAFGDEADAVKRQLTLEVIGKVRKLPAGTVIDVDTLLALEAETSWGRMGLLDEDEMLERIEAELMKMQVEDAEKRRTLEYALEERKEQIADHLHTVNERNLHAIERRRKHFEQHLREDDPHAYERLIRMRLSHIQHVETVDPKLAARLKKRYGIENM